LVRNASLPWAAAASRGRARAQERRRGRKRAVRKLTRGVVLMMIDLEV
jgi:hypothetical protein